MVAYQAVLKVHSYVIAALLFLFVGRAEAATPPPEEVARHSHGPGMMGFDLESPGCIWYYQNACAGEPTRVSGDTCARDGHQITNRIVEVTTTNCDANDCCLGTELNAMNDCADFCETKYGEGWTGTCIEYPGYCAPATESAACLCEEV
jgi:hypothetical protein